MKILVCVKVSRGEINPFDASALECALSLSDDVTVLSMGPESTKDILLPLTRLGAKVTLVTDRIYAGSDTLATAYILSHAVKKLGFDLIVCGKQSIDGDTAQVGPMLSQMCCCSLATNVLSAVPDENGVKAVTRLGEKKLSFPALITVERSYVLRFPGIFSKLGDVDVLTNKDLGCDESRCGLSGSPTRVIKTYENERGKRKCKFVSMSELDELISQLSKMEKADDQAVQNNEKLPCVWAVGKEVLSEAEKIADKVVLVEETNPETIVKKAQQEKPYCILWNADLEGRRNAPIAAAMLDTGLCADCTRLDVEKGELIMYRPAQGGSLYAKIKCLTTPVMATVRTKCESSDIIVSGGKGVGEKVEKLKAFAERIGAQLCASRGLVDMGKAPYEMQVGLTGKTVSPKIYIAVGISGAVHHTCAIEGADYVIAINPDKNARIFEYADYGITEEF